MPPSSSLLLLDQCVSCLHIIFHSKYGRLRCSATAFSCRCSQTHRSLSHLFLSHHFLSVFLLFYLPSPSFYIFSSPMSISFPPFTLFIFPLESISLFTLLSSHPFCQREAIGRYHTERAGMAGYAPEREINLSLSGRPSVALTRFSCTAASGVWKSAAAVWGSRYLWGVLHPDVYAACNHK